MYVPYFAVVRRPGPNWDLGRPMHEQDEWSQHASFMNALAEEGLIVLGGPVGGGDRFMFLVAADDEDAIRRRLAEDPHTVSERLVVATIEPWELVLGDLPA
jgi:uncharacterized protein YciI